MISEMPTSLSDYEIACAKIKPGVRVVHLGSGRKGTVIRSCGGCDVHWQVEFGWLFKRKEIIHRVNLEVIE